MRHCWETMSGSYTSQGSTRHGPHNRSMFIGSALQCGSRHGRPNARAWACALPIGKVLPILTSLRACLGVRGHVGQQTRVVGAIAPVGRICHGARARVLGPHAVLPRRRQSFGDEAPVHLGDVARDATALARGLTHRRAPARQAPRPRRRAGRRAGCDARRCRGPRPTGSRGA